MAISTHELDGTESILRAPICVDCRHPERLVADKTGSRPPMHLHAGICGRRAATDPCHAHAVTSLPVLIKRPRDSPQFIRRDGDASRRGLLIVVVGDIDLPGVGVVAVVLVPPFDSRDIVPSGASFDNVLTVEPAARGDLVPPA